jgi:hypothetical protein
MLFPSRAVYDIFETEPWPFARERRVTVGGGTHRSYNLTGFFDIKASLSIALLY